ncbi:MAG: hypothetical protein IME96_13130 [Proteobacteria bacterium]|nr:hypothetical protein [Pseudomonadota bacterium]
MDVIWGAFLTVLTLIGWAGQVIYAVSPRLGAKLGIGESEADIDPIFYIDARGEAIWDSMIIWTLPVAGILLMFNNPLWAYFGLVGGGCYLYFAGRNLTTRIMMQRRGIRIGTPYNIKIAYLFVTLWGLAAIITIIMAVAALDV